LLIQIIIFLLNFYGNLELIIFVTWDLRFIYIRFICTSFDENQELKFNQPQPPVQINNLKDVLQIPSRSITRSRAQKLKEALIGLIQDILTAQTKSKIELKPNHVLNLIWADEGIK